MQGVAVAPALNDENAGASAPGGALASALKAGGGGGDAVASACKPTRRAFGANLTNAAPSTAGKARRAFGDITNSTSKPFAEAPGTQPLKPAPQAPRPPAQLAPAVAAAAPAAASWWATEPTERPAGRTWEQQLEAAERAEDAEVEATARWMLAGGRAPLTGRRLQLQDDDELRDLPPPPPMRRAPASPPLPDSSLRGGMFGLLGLPRGSDEEFSALLPDVPLPPLPPPPRAEEGAAPQATLAAAAAPHSPGDALPW